MSIRAFDIADLLASLYDKSLASFDEATGRYRLLEVVRQYAADRLDECSENDDVKGRHLRWYVALAEEAGPKMVGPDQTEWLNLLELEHDNVRSALTWSAANDSAAGLALAGAIFTFWDVRGHVSEGRAHLSALLAADEPATATSQRARALNAAGVLAYRQGDYTIACNLHEEGLALRRELGDRRGIGSSLGNLGNLSHSQGDYALARALGEESLAIQRELGDRKGIAASLGNLANVAHHLADYATARKGWEESLAIQRELGDRHGAAVSLTSLGDVALELGDYSAARALCEESLAIQLEMGDRLGAAVSLTNLGDVALERGDYALARTHHAESLAILTEIGDRRNIAYSLESIACLAAAQHLAERSARLWGAAEALREELGAPQPPGMQRRCRAAVTAARLALGDDAAFDAAWQEGRAMTLDQAVAYALEEPQAG